MKLMLNKIILLLLTTAMLVIGTGNSFAMTDEEIDVLFNEALEQSETGDLAKSIAIFETILSERPSLNRVKMELALSNFRALNYAAAKHQAEEVLNTPGTPEPVKETIRAFLAEIEKQSKTHLFTPYISLGYIYDSNINVGPGTDTIDIAGGTLNLGTSGTALSSGGLQINGGVGHRYLFPQSFEFFGTPSALAWQSQASLFRNQYFDDGGDFHLNVFTARTGPALLAARKWRAAANIETNHISVGNDSVAWYVGLNPSFTWFIRGRTSLTASFQVQDRDFVQTSNNDRDATYLAGGVSLGHQFPGEVKPSVFVSGRVFDEDARTNRRSNDGYQMTGGFNLKPTSNSNAYINYSYRQRDYGDVEPVFGIARDESEKRLTLGGNYRFKSDNLLDDMVLNVSYTRTGNDSNVPIFTYDRSVMVLSLSRSF